MQVGSSSKNLQDTIFSFLTFTLRFINCKFINIERRTYSVMNSFLKARLVFDHSSLGGCQKLIRFQ